MIKDRIAIDLPDYDRLLCGQYSKMPGYRTFRAEGTDDWLLIATIDGNGRFGGAGDGFTCRRGDLVLLKPGTTHEYSVAPTADKWDLLWVHFHPKDEWLELLSWPPAETVDSSRVGAAVSGVARLYVADPHAWKAIVVCFLKMHRLSTGTRGRRTEFAMNALEELILLCDEVNPMSNASVDGRIKACMEYVSQHLDERITLEQLAELAGLSPSRFAHLFREELGMAPLQYVDLKRIDRAKQLLSHTSMRINEIARELGADPIYFSLRFKQHTGLSPREYRLKLAPSVSIEPYTI
jgi:AraC family transcriptional regulator of arabinose operon